MGTKGSYKGGGGSAGKALRDGVADWLETPPAGDETPDSSDPDQAPETSPDREPPKQQVLLPAIGLFRSRTGGTSDGPGGGGAGGSGGTGGGSGSASGGGAKRSASRSATTAGRAAAAAYAYSIADSDGLTQLGLDYGELSALDNPVDLTNRIVAAACGPLSDGTIEDEEQRVVAAQVAAWVIEEAEGGAPPEPVDVVREAIATIIFEAITNETAEQIRDGERPVAATKDAERQIRETAEALADRAKLSADGPTAEEFAQAIEDGIEDLRQIWGGGE